MFKFDKKHQKYEKYNPTNVDWIGDIPDGWEARKLKHISKSSFQYGANEAALDDNPNNPRFVRITDIDEKGNLRPETFKSLEEDIARDFILHDGDILFARSGATVGKTFQYRPDWGKCCYAGYLIRMTVDEKKATSDFIYYITKSSLYEGWKDSIFIKATIQNISAEKYKSFFVAIPSLEEQQKITNYLDEKTALLDEVIAKKKKQIEFLAEHRTALINNAITKGLDPNVEMKDSGLEWVGYINKNWSIEPLKRLVKDKITDGPHTTPDFIKDDNAIPFVSVEAVKDGKIDFNYRRGNISIDLHREYSQKCHPQKNDIFLVKSGSTTGKVAMVDVDFEFSVWSPLALIRVKLNTVIPRFVFYAMNSNIFQNQVQLFWSFGTQPNIGMGVIETLVMPVPSIKEQNDIVSYLDNEMKYIDDMIAKIEKSIELLEEYKTSLISHVVSGKIQVL